VLELKGCIVTIDTEHPAPQAQSAPFAGIPFGGLAWFSWGNAQYLILQINHMFVMYPVP
jgi:hypothetical protein